MSYSYYNFALISNPYQDYVVDNFLDFIYNNKKAKIRWIERLALAANWSSETLNPVSITTNLQKCLLHYILFRVVSA